MVLKVLSLAFKNLELLQDSTRCKNAFQNSQQLSDPELELHFAGARPFPENTSQHMLETLVHIAQITQVKSYGCQTLGDGIKMMKKVVANLQKHVRQAMAGLEDMPRENPRDLAFMSHAINDRLTKELDFLEKMPADLTEANNLKNTTKSFRERKRNFGQRSVLILFDPVGVTIFRIKILNEMAVNAWVICHAVSESNLSILGTRSH